jgi:hypothetical protein
VFFELLVFWQIYSKIMRQIVFLYGGGGAKLWQNAKISPARHNKKADLLQKDVCL